MKILYLSLYVTAAVAMYYLYHRLDDWLFRRRIERLIAEERARLERERVDAK